MEVALKEKLGQKCACVACGIKFYDLNSLEPSCPRCKADPREVPAVAPKKTKARKSTAKKSTTKKTAAKKTTAKKPPAKKTPAQKTAAKKAPAKKTPANNKTPAKKPTARKASDKEGSSEAGADPDLELEQQFDDIDLDELDLAGSEDIADEEVAKD